MASNLKGKDMASIIKYKYDPWELRSEFRLLQLDLGLIIKGANLLGKWGQIPPNGEGQISFPTQVWPSQIS